MGKRGLLLSATAALTVTLFIIPAAMNGVQAGSPLEPALQTCDPNPPDDYKKQISGTVDGDELDITISSRFGGAVESLTWRGKEFINIYDHGRQISYAWAMNDFGECYNPTEPGTARDGLGPTSSSQLLEVCQPAENILTTRTQPAYWLAPGESGFCDRGATTAINDEILSDQYLDKTIQIGYQGIDNVIEFNATITLPQDFQVVQLEIPTGYLTYEFTQYWNLNPETGELMEAQPQELQEPWSFLNVSNLPPILSTPDGQYAMGAYTAEPIAYYTILAYTVPNPADRTNKWNMVMREEDVPAGQLSYQSFAIVGTLEDVQAAMIELYQLHPSELSPAEGYFDVVSCQNIAGWAWDPGKPDEPVDVAIYDVAADGSETLLVEVPADRYREDLETALGDNGVHGFDLPASQVIPDGQPHTLRVYAVNDDPRLPDRILYNNDKPITCPQFEPAATATANTSTYTPDGDPSAGATETTGATPLLPCLANILPLGLGAVLLFKRRKPNL